MAEVLLALEELHRREIIYRNLRPASVLLDEDGHALLADIGLTHEGVGRLRELALGPTFSVLATPESLRNEPITKATDWYCFGVLIHQLLFNKLPFAVGR